MPPSYLQTNTSGGRCPTLTAQTPINTPCGRCPTLTDVTCLPDTYQQIMCNDRQLTVTAQPYACQTPSSMSYVLKVSNTDSDNPATYLTYTYRHESPPTCLPDTYQHITCTDRFPTLTVTAQLHACLTPTNRSCGCGPTLGAQPHA